MQIECDVTYLWVALGGAVGAVSRFAVAQWTGARWGWTFPWGTLAVNLTGSLAIGLVMTLLLARGADPTYRLLLVTGFLGGYTTFSAFTFETLALLAARRWEAAALYIGANVALGLLATALGLGLGRLFIR